MQNFHITPFMHFFQFLEVLQHFQKSKRNEYSVNLKKNCEKISDYVNIPSVP